MSDSNVTERRPKQRANEEQKQLQPAATPAFDLPEAIVKAVREQQEVLFEAHGLLACVQKAVAELDGGEVDEIDLPNALAGIARMVSRAAVALDDAELMLRAAEIARRI